MGFVVVGVDGSSESERALEWALGYAEVHDADVVAVTGYRVPWTIYITPTYQEDDYARDARDMLEPCVSRALQQFPDGRIEARLVPEPPGIALTRASANPDLLIVGARGHGALSDVHIGSVAHACVNHARCPVVVYRDAESVSHAD